MPSNFFAYNFRSLYETDEKYKALFELFEIHATARLFVIDGIADFVADTNLAKECNRLVSELMAVAERLNICIIVFLHENPGLSTKMRGHMGSEIERKCYGAIAIEKNREKKVHIIKSRYLRDSGDFDDILFQYDEDQRRMVSLTGEEREDYRLDVSGGKRKRELRCKLAYQCLVGGSENIRHNEFIRRILNHAPIIEGKTFSDTTAKSRLKEMMELGIVEKTPDDRYRLIPQDDDTEPAEVKNR